MPTGDWQVTPSSQTTTAGVDTGDYTIELLLSAYPSGAPVNSTFTLDDSGHGGTFTPSSVTLLVGQQSGTFKYRNASASTYTLNVSQSSGYTPSSLSVTAVVNSGAQTITPAVVVASPIVGSPGFTGTGTASIGAVVVNSDGVVGSPTDRNTQTITPFVVLGDGGVGIATALFPGAQTIAATVVTQGDPSGLPPGVPTPNVYKSDGTGTQTIAPSVVIGGQMVGGIDVSGGGGSPNSTTGNPPATLSNSGNLMFAICPNMDGDPWSDEVQVDTGVLAAVGFYTGSQFGAVYTVNENIPGSNFPTLPVVKVKVTSNPNDWSGAASYIALPGAGDPLGTTRLTGYPMACCTDHWGAIHVMLNGWGNGGTGLWIASTDQGKTWVQRNAFALGQQAEAIGSAIVGVSVQASSPFSDASQIYFDHQWSLDGGRTTKRVP